MSLDHEPVKHVKMTKFLCHELLFEYVQGTLDPRREKDIETFLPTDRESQRELERLKRALAYTEKAAAARVSPALHGALLSFEPAWQKRLRELSIWSSQRGWRMLPYIFVVLTLATGLAVWQPWKKADLHEVTLAEQARVESEGPATPPVIPMAPITAPSPQPTTTTTPEVIPAPTVAAKTAEPVAPEEPIPARPVKGELRRGFISVTDFENAWPAIKEKIIVLGGKSAGTQELGWMRRTGQSYFHFSIPESNFSELEMFLGTFGPVRFDVENAPRIMPQGQFRIILTVKDADTHEGSPETP